ATEIWDAGVVAGKDQGMKVVIGVLKEMGVEDLVPGICEKISSTGNYTKVTEFVNTIYSKYAGTCTSLVSDFEAPAACEGFEYNFGIFTADGGRGAPAKYAVNELIKGLAGKADQAAKAKAAEVSAYEKLLIETTQEKAIEAASTHMYTTIAYSITAILIIVLIMVIIYLILRYRRKKKMKKKLQYIKLLKE
ncbi:rifin, partial [Plasmodium falciparum RAJ116]